MLNSVRLKNFKSFRDVRVNLGPRNFLVGPNMAGKSNFIEVLRFLKRVSFPQAGVWALPNAFTGGFHEYTWAGGDSKLILIALEGMVADTADTEWNYEISILGDERGSIRVQEERLFFPASGHELIANRDQRRSLVNKDGTEVLSDIDSSRSAIEFEIPNWDGSFLRQFIGLCRFYRLTPRLMRELNPAAAPPFLTETGDNLPAWMMYLQTRYSETFARMQRVYRDVFPDLVDVFSWPTQQGTVLVASHEKHLRRPVSMWQMSDGELIFLAFLSLIFGPPELGASLYCVEEPENHLHPSLIENLMQLLKQVQAELGPSAAQVIATTHSPHLVDQLSLDELIVLQKCDGATTVTYPRDKAHLRELLQNEELGLGDLFYSGALHSE